MSLVRITVVGNLKPFRRVVLLLSSAVLAVVVCFRTESLQATLANKCRIFALLTYLLTYSLTHLLTYLLTYNFDRIVRPAKPPKFEGWSNNRFATNWSRYS